MTNKTSCTPNNNRKGKQAKEGNRTEQPGRTGQKTRQNKQSKRTELCCFFNFEPVPCHSEWFAHNKHKQTTRKFKSQNASQITQPMAPDPTQN